MIKSFQYFVLFFLFSTISKSANIVVIDVNKVINDSVHFIEISNDINKSQIDYKKYFKETEQNLYKSKEELENSKLILSDDEFNINKDIYYKKVVSFEDEVNKFNSHYENEIIKIKNIIFSEITNLIQDYAQANQIEIILDKNQYLIASEKINITEIIITELNSVNIDLSFEKYEN